MNVPSLWTDTGSTLEKVVLSIALGFMIAMFVILINKRGIGRIARKLIERGANTPESALTLEELGIRALGAGPALRDPGSLLRRSVRVAPENADDSPERALKSGEVSTARFYVPEEDRIAAEVRFDARNTTLPIAIVGIIAIGIAAYLCIKYIPQLLEFRLFND